MLRPKNATMVSSRNSDGMDSNISRKRIMAMSSQPLKKPMIPP